MKIVIVAAIFPPSNIVSGLSESVFMLSKALIAQGCGVTVVCSDADINGRLASGSSNVMNYDGIDIYRYYHRLRANFTLRLPFDEIIKSCDILILNETFSAASIIASFKAKKYNKPYIFFPHGSLMSEALKKSTKKKEIFMKLASIKMIKGAKKVVTTSAQEEKAYKDLRLNVPVCIIPNGCIIHSLPTEHEIRIIDEKWPELKGKQVVLCLTRISQEKGLLMLMKAWENLGVKYKNTVLVVAGSGDRLLEEQLCQEIKRLKTSVNIIFIGSVFGDLKYLLYGRADIVVVPSKTENFGYVIAESLASARPVVATQGTPWSILEKYRCGKWVAVSTKGIVEGLDELLQVDKDELLCMGMRGREVISNHYNWENVAGKIVGILDEILSGREPSA